MILHLARKLANHPCCIHPSKWVRMLDRCWPEMPQRWIHCDHPIGRWVPQLVLLHACNQRPHLVEKVREACPGARVVALSYNDLWLRNRDERVIEAFRQADLVMGALSHPEELPEGIRFHEVGHLVDERIFRRAPVPRDIQVFVPRGYNGRSVYWTTELRQAMWHEPWEVWFADGSLSEAQMAERYQRALCTPSLREDAGPSYSLVEACLCGSIPLVADWEPVARHFRSDGAAIGAVIVQRDPESIREGISRVLRMNQFDRMAWIYRNETYFRDSTMAVQGPRAVAVLQGLL